MPMEIIKKAIAAVLREADVAALTDDTPLGTLAGWDSLSSVSILLEIEYLTDRDNLTIEFSDGTTIAEMIGRLRAQGVEV
jgi:acyl carrier protein